MDFAAVADRLRTHASAPARVRAVADYQVELGRIIDTTNLNESITYDADGNLTQNRIEAACIVASRFNACFISIPACRWNGCQRMPPSLMPRGRSHIRYDRTANYCLLTADDLHETTRPCHMAAQRNPAQLRAHDIR